MAGVSICIVFCILVLLVLLLYVFSWFSSMYTITRKNPDNTLPESPSRPLAAGQPSDSAEEDLLAAIEVAVHLHLSCEHYDESGVLTITQAPSFGWHTELNPQLGQAGL